MGNRFLLYILVISLNTSGCGQRTHTSTYSNNLENDFGGRLLVEPGTHRLGRVLGGIDKSIKVETKLTNIGNKSLYIGDLEASCDCTSANLSKKILKPGESSILVANIKVGESQEPRSTRITVRSSDPDRPRTQVVVEWQTNNLLTTREPSFSFLDLPEGESKTAEIPILSRHMSVCRNCEIELEFDPKVFQCVWILNNELVGQNHDSDRLISGECLIGRIRLQLTPDQNGENQFYRNIRVSLNCQDGPKARLLIPVRWSFVKSVSWTPTRIFLGNRTQGELVEKEIFIKNSINGLIRILSITCSDSSVQIESELPGDPIPHGFISFKFAIPPKPGLWAETLILKTDKESSNEIRIPISCMIAESASQ